MILDPRRWYRLTVAALAAARDELDAVREAFEHAVDLLERREADLAGDEEHEA